MTDQTLFVALDVSLETTAICIVDTDGAIRREISVQTEPEAIGVILEPDRGQMARIDPRQAAPSGGLRIASRASGSTWC